MPFFPQIPTWENATLMTTQFLGLNRGLSIADGEMADMHNMSSDNFPVLSTRQSRGKPVFPVADGGITEHDGAVSGMLGTDRLIVCAGEKVYMDGEEVPITLSAESHMQPKHLVSMGAYVCIWPDKVYFNTANLADHGSMGMKWTPAADAVISAMMCRKDGTNYDMESITVSDTAPAEPEDQQLWLDTSGENDVLKQYSTIYQEWVQVATTFIKIQATGIGKDLKDADVVHLSGVRAGSNTAPVAETKEETLTFTSPNFYLYSSFTTTHVNGVLKHTTASTKTHTITFPVSGIPAGAHVTSARLSFMALPSAYGAKVLTVNGVAVNEDRDTPNVVDVDVTGNGEVSCKFVFQSNNRASSLGDHGGSVQFTDITLNVTYGVTGGGEEEVSDADSKQLEALNTTNIIYGRGDDYIIVAGLLRRHLTLANSIAVELKIPDLDYVCEANNRLWGCSYSRIDGTLTNEIRACALGDFRNWYKFDGTSMESYVMSVGSDGPFTGAFSLQGVPLMWKEDYLHKISGTQPSNYTLNTIKCRGVQDGSWRSLAVVNETLYYKARTDVMAYDGAMPYAVSEKLGTDRYHDAVGGGYRDKYYICMQDDSALWHVYVWDSAKGLWHKEDNVHIPHMASVDGDLVLAVEEEEKTFLRTVGNASKSEEEFPWSVTFGVFGYAYERAKYLSRFNIRAQMTPGSEMTFEIMYDSNKEWENMGTMKSKTLRTFMLPVIPRRCDHCQIRIRGTGKVSIYSIARVFEEGGN